MMIIANHTLETVWLAKKYYYALCMQLPLETLLMRSTNAWYLLTYHYHYQYYRFYYYHHHHHLEPNQTAQCVNNLPEAIMQRMRDRRHYGQK